MNNSFKFFAMVAFLSMAIVGSGIPTQLASAQTASQHSDLVQTVSTWQFDQSGHLISVPGRLEAKYDANDHLQEVRLHDVDSPRTTTYTVAPGTTPGTINVRVVHSKIEDGKDSVFYDSVYTGITKFELVPYGMQVQEHGQLVRISLAEALKADPSTILIGVEVRTWNVQKTSFFVGAKYRLAKEREIAAKRLCGMVESALDSSGYRPPDWKPEEHYGFNKLFEIYDECMKVQTQWGEGVINPAKRALELGAEPLPTEMDQ